jgi:hypothetical protein
MPNKTGHEVVFIDLCPLGVWVGLLPLLLRFSAAPLTPVNLKMTNLAMQQPNPEPRLNRV